MANVIGACIFLFYVGAALIFTGFLTSHLSRAYARTGAISGPRAHVLLFSLLAFVSFAVSSYNMVNVLVFFYSKWAAPRTLKLLLTFVRHAGLAKGSRTAASLSWDLVASPKPSLLTTILKNHGITPALKMVSATTWEWLMSTSPFLDFAQAICKPGPTYWWILQAICATSQTTGYIGVEGKVRRVPHVWAYLSVAQILPPSFSQNLFFVSMLLRPKADPQHKIWVPNHPWQIIPWLLFAANLIIAPRAKSPETLLPILLLTRLLLFAIWLIPEIVPASMGMKLVKTIDVKEAYSNMRPAVGIIFAYLFFQVSAQNIWTFGLAKTLKSIDEHPAVSTLGYDYLIWIISMVAWGVLQGFDPAPASENIQSTIKMAETKKTR